MIVAAGTPAILAAKKATSVIPIVFPTAGDPVGQGLVASLAHPGGNVTGLSNMGPEIATKQMELLKQAVPRLTRVAHLVNPRSSATVWLARWADSAGRALGLQVQQVAASTGAELDVAFAAMRRARAGAVIVVRDAVFRSLATQLVALSAQHRLPVMFGDKAYVRNGGLMSYSQDSAELYRSAARYVDKILNGARPGDLPVEQPTKFELLINLKTAKALGLTIPPSVLARADEVIQ